MAGVSRSNEGGAAATGVGEMLSRAGAVWLGPVREQLRAMYDQGRLPHALLLLGRAGAGQSEIGLWLAARLLCARPGKEAACGSCRACRQILAGTHPDLHFVGIESDASMIRVEQIRALSDTLSLKSYSGGAKVCLIDPADGMNMNSFNALLKTLEEPHDETFLILAASRIDRLPATIVSRVARVRMPLPTIAEALAWLGQQAGPTGANALLELANGAPFLALRYAEAGLGELDGQMLAALETAKNGGIDIVATAAAWAADQPEARLSWLESWLTGRLKEACLASDLVNNNRLPWLSGRGSSRMIRVGYGLLDRVREARLLVAGALNTQLLFEGLLVSLAGLLGREADNPRESRV